jgi:Fe-S-cluster containining protein
MAPPSISFEERFFGPLVPGRECGPCTACCFEITIEHPALAKPPRTLCVHCAAGGCSIYAERPDICRSWFCTWRRLADLPDHLRPDQCGLLATVAENPEAENPLARLYIVVQWLDERPITKSAAADELLAAMRRYGLPVWVGSGDRMSLHYPREEVALHLIRGTTPSAAIAREVDAWRKRLPQSPLPAVRP